MLEIYIPFSHKSNNICKQDPVSTMQKTGWTSHSSLWMRSLVQDSRAGHWSSALDLVVFENNPFGKALVEDQDSGHWQWLVVIKRAIKVWSAEWPSHSSVYPSFLLSNLSQSWLTKIYPPFCNIVKLTRTNWPRKVRELILDSDPWSQGVKG